MDTFTDSDGWLLYQGKMDSARLLKMNAMGATKVHDAPEVPDGMAFPKLSGGQWASGDPDGQGRKSIDEDLIRSDAKMIRRMEDFFRRTSVFDTLDQEFKDLILERAGKRTARSKLRPATRRT